MAPSSESYLPIIAVYFKLVPCLSEFLNFSILPKKKQLMLLLVSTEKRRDNNLWKYRIWKILGNLLGSEWIKTNVVKQRLPLIPWPNTIHLSRRNEAKKSMFKIRHQSLQESSLYC